MSFHFNNTPPLEFSIRHRAMASGQPPMQYVELRLGHSSHLVVQSSGQILQQTPPTPIANALFQFPLFQLQHPPFLPNFHMVQFLSSFNLPIATSHVIFQSIASFALHLAAGDVHFNFHIIAAVDFVETLWVDIDSYPLNSPASGRGAPARAIERVRNQKFDGVGLELEEMGDCSVCWDELDGEMEVSRIPCGHVFHKSCILKWLHRSNSCPLCRAKLEE